MKRFAGMILTAAMAAAFALAGCSGNEGAPAEPETAAPEQTAAETAAPEAYAIDYLVLVNKENPLPETWEDEVEIVDYTNSLGDPVQTERAAYDAYLGLKAALEEEGVYVDLDSAYRSVAAQQEIVEDFTERYGEDYVRQYVAVPGYSEHHTGLALDLYLNIDGEDVYMNEDMVEYPEIWAQIHAKLADYGFILRYLEGKEDITGYSYEPWHIRYVGDPDIAREITEQGITLEEYLGVLPAADAADDAAQGGAAPEVSVDYGNSTLYTQEEMDEAIGLIEEEFAQFPEGCELQNIRYAGDECVTAENIAWMNEMSEGPIYMEVIEFLTDFHTPAEGSMAFNPDEDYTDYQWWLARTERGAWERMTWGY